MSTAPIDFTVELLRQRPGVALGSGMAPITNTGTPSTHSPPQVPFYPGDLIDLTSRTSVEDMTSVNRAIDRDLLTFKTGDVTLGFWNADGYMTELFALFGVTDRWQIRIFRRGAIQFWGVVIGQGSLRFDKKEKTCEITAYGLTRILSDTSAAVVARGVIDTLPLGTEANDSMLIVNNAGAFNVADILHISNGVTSQVTQVTQVFYPDRLKVNVQMITNYAPGSEITREVGFMTVATATATQTTLTLTDPADGTNATAGLLTGDILHITDQVNSEDVTVKQVTSATVVSLDAALANTYAAGSPVTLTTPFYRYKTIETLVRSLFAAAGIPVADLRLNNSQFNSPAPSGVNLTGLGLSNRPYTTPAERSSRVYVTEETTGTYYQADPDDDWTLEDATVRPWVDWSRYYTQAETKPTIILRSHLTGEGTGNEVVHMCGFDYKPATKTVYFNDGGKIKLRTTADGTTWSAASDLVNLPAAFPANGTAIGCELDASRQLIYAYGDDGLGNREFQVYDKDGLFGAAGTFYDLKQGDDTGKSYYAPVWMPELDLILCLRSSTRTGPAFEIAAFRGKSRLWVRRFPNVLIKSESGTERYTYPTHNLRYLNGALVTVAVQDVASQFIVSNDQFVSYSIGQINAGGKARVFGARVLDKYRYFTYVAANPRGYGVAAPFYAGVVAYADFEDKSCAQALKDLAILVNAVFWVDDGGAGHFVARDLYDAGAVLPLDDGVNRLDMDRIEDPIWEESVSFVEVSSADASGVAGKQDFGSSGLTIDSPLVPNEAYALALATDYFEFYGRRRAFIEMNVRDPDGTIYQPLDRKTLDGIRYFVYESDHNLAEDEISVKLLEDA